MTADDRLPVIVATGQCLERDEIVSVLDLAARAAAEALAQAPGLRQAIQRVSMVHTISRAGVAPASVLARRLGLSPASTELTTVGGNSPQWLVNRAAAAIAAGELDVALIVGGEAQRSRKLARELRTRTGQASGGATGAGRGEDGEEHGALAPDPVVGDERPGAGPAELGAGLVAPIHVYPLFESVLAARAGRSFAEQRAWLGTVMAPFTEVAAKHPVAWFPEARTPAELSQIGPDNRLVAEPYPKRMCAIMAVDQAAAVVVSSLGAARRLGLADQAVFCWSGADAADVWFPTERPDLGESPAIRAAGQAALGAVGLGIDDIGAIDLYSCFPSAVQLGAAALGLGIDDRRGLTVTGGLPYFGGPGSNYTLHAIATMADILRERGGTGLCTGLGWYATKHSVGVYGATPPPSGWQRGDTAAAQRAIDASAVPVATEAEGTATVVAATIVAGEPGGPAVAGAPVVARLDDGRQVAAVPAPGEDLQALAGRNLVGERIMVAGSPPTYRLAG